VEAVQEDLTAKAKARQARAVAAAESRAEERISEAVRSGREARDSAASASVALQQAKQEVDKLRAERKSLQERVERWRREREASQEAEAAMALKLEEAAKAEKAAAKEASKATKRADKAEAEARRLGEELSGTQAELEAARTSHHSETEELHRQLEAAAVAHGEAVAKTREAMLQSEQARVDTAVAKVMDSQREMHSFYKAELDGLQEAMQEGLSLAASLVQETVEQQMEGGTQLQEDVQGAHSQIKDMCKEVLKEAEAMRGHIAKEILAFRKPGGKDPRQVMLELEEAQCECQHLAAQNQQLTADVEAVANSRDAEAAALQEERDARAAVDKDLAAERKQVEVLTSKASVLAEKIKAGEESVAAAGARIVELTKRVGEEEQCCKAVGEELETTKRRLQEQLTINADKSILIAKLEGQIEGVKSQLDKEMEAATAASEEAAVATLKALSALRRKYFELTPGQPPKLTRVPSSSSNTSAPGFGSSNSRGDLSTGGRRPSNLRAPPGGTKGGQVVEGVGVLVPGARESEKEAREGGWVAVKLTERGLDPAHRDWSKRVSSAWDAAPEDDEPSQLPPAKLRAAEIQREMLRLEGCLLLGLQEALREVPVAAPATSQATAGKAARVSSQQPAAGPGSVRPTPPVNRNCPMSGAGESPAAGSTPRSAAAAGEGDVAGILEKRLRGARERVERIRTDAEGMALKNLVAETPAKVETGSGGRRRVQHLSGEAHTAGHQISEWEYGGENSGHFYGNGATEEDYDEVLAVLDVLGGGGPAGRRPIEPSAYTAPENRHQRPRSGSSANRLEQELNYGGVGRGGYREQPAWQDS